MVMTLMLITRKIYGLQDIMTINHIEKDEHHHSGDR